MREIVTCPSDLDLEKGVCFERVFRFALVSATFLCPFFP